jgi:hypothetical protein
VPAAGVVWHQVPDLPATVQTNSGPFWSRQKSSTFQNPEFGGPVSLLGAAMLVSLGSGQVELVPSHSEVRCALV